MAAVTVTAPVMEEMLFRGVLQTWLEHRPLGGVFVLMLALLVSLPTQRDAWATAWTRSVGHPIALRPVLFVVVLCLIYGVVYRLSRKPTWPALFAASTLFAAVHSFAWPSPIPLFILALGLGWLAQAHAQPRWADCRSRAV